MTLPVVRTAHAAPLLIQNATAPAIPADAVNASSAITFGITFFHHSSPIATSARTPAVADTAPNMISHHRSSR